MHKSDQINLDIYSLRQYDVEMRVFKSAEQSFIQVETHCFANTRSKVGRSMQAGKFDVKPKRTWVYRQSPSSYDVAPCECGNVDTLWSEFKGQVWCPICEIDCTPKHNGIFDGPIPVGATALMGISFDRIEIGTGRLIKFDVATGRYIGGEELAVPQ